MSRKRVIPQLPTEKLGQRSVVVLATMTEPRKYYIGVGDDLSLNFDLAMRFTAGAKSTDQIMTVVESIHGEKLEPVVVPEIVEGGLDGRPHLG